MASGLARKQAPSRPRQWRKVHLGIDAETLEVRAIEFTGSHVGDAPMLSDLLDQSLAAQSIGMVSADGACGMRTCHAAIAKRGAAAVIPPRRNGKPWKEHTIGAQARNEAIRAGRRLSRAIWRQWSGYQPRRGHDAVPETPRPGASMSRDFDRQGEELQVRAAILNRFTVFGAPDHAAHRTSPATRRRSSVLGRLRSKVPLHRQVDSARGLPRTPHEAAPGPPDNPCRARCRPSAGTHRYST